MRVALAGAAVIVLSAVWLSCHEISHGVTNVTRPDADAAAGATEDPQPPDAPSTPTPNAHP